MKPVSGFCIAFSRNSGGMLLERAMPALALAVSHLRRVTYNNGRKRNHLRRRAFMQNGTVRAGCIRSNDDRQKDVSCVTLLSRHALFAIAFEIPFTKRQLAAPREESRDFPVRRLRKIVTAKESLIVLCSLLISARFQYNDYYFIIENRCIYMKG